MRGLTLSVGVNDSPGTSNVQPLDRLTDEAVETIHEASMHIVTDLGIQLDHERARAVFRACGAEVHDDDVVTVPRDVIEDSVASAPTEFVLHARDSDKDIAVGGDGRPVRAPGYGPPYVDSIAEGRRRARLSDYETLTKLAHAEDVINCTGYSVCEPADVGGREKHVAMLERSLTLSDQPVMASARGEDRAQECLDMVGIAVGDRDLQDPYVAGLVNTVPPRRIDGEMLAGLIAFAEAGQPVLVSSFTMAGASGPETLPASIAQANAETLVGIALAQQLNPGTPVVYGVPTSNIDTRYGSLSIGSPESALVVAVAAQLGRYYGLPTRAGGGLTDAKALDYQSGFESTLIQTVTDLAGVDFVLHAAGILDSYETVSPEKFVLDCEGLRYLDRFRRGFRVSPDSLQLDRIADVEPAGHFIDDAPDAGNDDFFRPTVIEKRSRSDWADNGRKSTAELAQERIQKLLDAYEQPRLDADRRHELDQYVANRD